MKKAYECFFCGRKDVKLWRPYGNDEPLICANCAEGHQSPRKDDECIWEKHDGYYRGKPTGRKLPLPKWEVNEKGCIPAYGPQPEGLPIPMTEQLLIDLDCDLMKGKEITVVPAVPNEEGLFWGYTAVPKEGCEWWEKLPTK